MATVKKPMKKATKKAAPKMMRKAAPMMQAPPSGSSPMGGPMMKKGGKVKKAAVGTTLTTQTTKDPNKSGMSMKDLIKKYPGTDTTAKGDVRGSEMNAYAPKKVLQKYNDTYNAFEKKYKGKVAKQKMGGKTMKSGGKMTKKCAYGCK